MSAITLIAPGQGEVVGDAPDRRVEILSDHASLNATWSRFAPGRDGADLHVHRDHADHFFVLEGVLTVRLGREHVAVPAGTLARIPPLVVHGFRNTSDAEVRFLNLHAPGCGFADYMRALRDGRTPAYDQHPPPPDGGRAPGDAVFTDDGPATEADGLRTVVLANAREIAVATVDHTGPGIRVDADRVESLYVLDGELTLTIAGREHRAVAGTWVQIPAGVSRRIAGSATFLDIHTPG